MMFPKIVIPGADGKPYLTRWVLFRAFGYKIYLHHIEQSDGDRHLHDHPWPFISFLLKGSYAEFTNKGAEIIHWFSARLKPDVPHRLVLIKPVLSLVFVGRKVRNWGFHTEDGWVHHTKYLDFKFGEGNWKDLTSQYD